MNYFDAAIEVIKIINSYNFKAYIVGGAVRDYLLGYPFNDIDISTSAFPSDIKKLFKTKEKGLKYNAITVIYKGFEFETTTFRKEIDYKDYRHPEFIPCDNINEDLIRRDFTINAMAMDENENIIDLFSGKKDLENKLIRAVINPDKKFKEDALRMLRCCYFAAKLNFIIDDETLVSIKENAYLTKNLTFDRISWELEKLSNSKYNSVGFKYLEELGLINYLPIFKDAIKLINSKNIKINSYDDLLLLSAYFNQDKLNEFKLGSKQKSEIQIVLNNINSNLTNIVLFDLGLNVIKKIIFVKNSVCNETINLNDVCNRYNQLPIKSKNDLIIHGKTILEVIGNDYQKKISKIERELITLICLGKLKNTKEDIENYLKKYIC